MTNNGLVRAGFDSWCPAVLERGHGNSARDRAYKLAGVRPKAVIHRFWSDGSFEVFWELEGIVACLKVYWANDEDRTVEQTVRMPPGPLPPLPKGALP